MPERTFVLFYAGDYDLAHPVQVLMADDDWRPELREKKPRAAAVMRDFRGELRNRDRLSARDIERLSVEPARGGEGASIGLHDVGHVDEVAETRDPVRNPGDLSRKRDERGRDQRDAQLARPASDRLAQSVGAPARFGCLNL